MSKVRHWPCTFKDVCNRSRYQGQGQVITFCRHYYLILPLIPVSGTQVINYIQYRWWYHKIYFGFPRRSICVAMKLPLNYHLDFVQRRYCFCFNKLTHNGMKHFPRNTTSYFHALNYLSLLFHQIIYCLEWDLSMCICCFISQNIFIPWYCFPGVRMFTTSLTTVLSHKRKYV